MTEVRKPRVKLVGEDGNAFAIIGAVSKALKRDDQSERAEEWRKAAMACKSYDAVLQLVFSYAEPY